MTDETDESEEIEFVADQPDSRTEVYEWTSPSGKGGMYLFPIGVEEWAANNNVGLIHIDKTTGACTVQGAVGEPFRAIDKTEGGNPPKPTRLASVK